MSRRTAQRKKFRIPKNLITTIIIVFIVGGVALFDFIQRSKRPPSSGVVLARVQGDPRAPLSITEFIDFQCQECAQAFALLHDLMAKYPAQIYIEAKYFPLRQPHSLDSAIYAECAAQQGKFWEFVELLYQRQAEWRTLADVTAMYQWMAQEAGLNPHALASCVRSDEAKSVVFSDKLYGETLFVKATPTFFINKKMFVGYKSISQKLEGYFEK